MDKKVYKEPDIKAKRFRAERTNIIDASFVKSFKEKHPKYKDISESDIKKIVKTFNETLWKEVIDTRDGVQLPEGLGVLFIATCKTPVKENVDFAKSKKYGFTVTNKNWETDGKLAKIFFTSYPSKLKFQNRECWKFIGCRNFKRSVAKFYPENWTMYIELSPNKKLRKVYTAISLKQSAQKNLDRQLNDYNEFDL
jgi:hypothetical protein